MLSYLQGICEDSILQCEVQSALKTQYKTVTICPSPLQHISHGGWVGISLSRFYKSMNLIQERVHACDLITHFLMESLGEQLESHSLILWGMCIQAVAAGKGAGMSPEGGE